MIGEFLTMIFRKKISQNTSEFTRKIKSQICSVDNFGVNWVYNKNHKIILYYESGETDSRGVLQLLKSYFLGYYKIKNDITTITGIIISGPFVLIFIVLALIFECVFLDVKEFLCSCIFYLPILIWIYLGEKKNRESILDYLNILLNSD